MTKVTIDESIIQALNQFAEPVELFDQSGRMIGQFLPANSLPIKRASDNCPVSEEELQRIRNQKVSKSGAANWAERGGTSFAR